MLPQPVLGGDGGRVTLLLLSSDAGVTEKEASAATHNGISDCCSWRSCGRDAGDGGWSLNGDSSKVNHLQICLQELVLSNFHSFCSSLYNPPSQSSVQAKPISIFISYWTEFGIPQCYYYMCNPFPTQWVALPLLEPDEDNIVQMWDLFLNLIVPKMTRENAL
ncbi:hypothetical protein NC653_010242 [Populus alba x Populus x berolinensis]|uniref:Uncharacterized protein n=1 Tax=Populus alba x Populus x berolinensis TaxID=444605 RepID=A0AAD6QZC7_9ROSI|nr:hypothetical protein NC653_010229 [Populus alba x Populus x berolinensis]KAJ6999473.1 hypothetical protein NC653_010242 [Populus alba x Populus x berolinensis]